MVEARADLHALEMAQVEAALARGASPFFEGNPFVAGRLLDWASGRGLEVRSVFLAPLSRAELSVMRERGADLQGALAALMERKLRRRTERQKGRVPEEEMADLRIRAHSAFPELQQAWRFAHLIPNHDGEDSEHWDAPNPTGDAGRALQAFVELLEGKSPALTERWRKSEI